jgi:hypothetical protein
MMTETGHSGFRLVAEGTKDMLAIGVSYQTKARSECRKSIGNP